MEHQNSDLRLKKTDIIFVIGFILGLAVLSFVFGVRIGKKTALSSLGDIEQMKVSEKKFAEQSEKMNAQVTEVVETTPVRNMENRIKDEFVNKVIVEKTQPKKVAAKAIEPIVDSKPVIEDIQTSNSNSNSNSNLDPKPTMVPYISSGETQFSRKRTILVGEFLSLDQAQLFAQAFQLRGYEVYIQKFPQSGIEKLRVSLGRFQDQKEAKSFMQANSNMFLKNKYKITSFL